MLRLACTLLCDGPFDTALAPILRWVLEATDNVETADFNCPDLSRLPRPPRDLAEGMAEAIRLSPCDILFVHRDAEGQPPEHRYEQVRDAIAAAKAEVRAMPYICVVPVRMSEAWLLLDEHAIRLAAGDPNGTQPLGLPPVGRVEDIPDAKELLHGILRTASGLSRRRLKAFSAPRAARLIPERMNGFACLRALAAFRRLEADVRSIVVGLSAR
jgi:hypothetical protein